MAARHRDISVAEFFQKNRHLLGFDSPKKALLTAVKEAVDNSLDACEEAGILPEVEVRIEVAGNGSAPPPSQADRFIVTVTDNGPGIPRKNVGKVFAKLLYGSKFHRLRMSRGQQGIGISAAGMYGQLTTGKPVRVTTKIQGEAKAHCLEISIDTKKNEPVEHETKQVEWDREHGTQVAIELEGRYQKGRASVEEYLELCSIANPHAHLVYQTPDGETKVYARGVAELPRAPREIKPHPLGIELGMLIKMAHDTKSHWLSGFLSTDFSRVSPKVGDEVCKLAKLSPRLHPREIMGDKAEALFRAIQQTKFMNPPTDCLSPIGEKAILAGLVKTLKADFYTAATRPPKVYRGNPFVIECGLAYGKGDRATAQDPAKAAAEEIAKLKNGEVEAKAEGEEEEEVELARVIRFANRVPLLYQQAGCATYQATLKTAWKNYGLSQSRGAPPHGPLVIFIHMASVWVPFTSEAKEAIAGYDEILDEVKRALQECGRKLGIWIHKREHAKNEFDRRHTFQRYIEEVAEACKRLKGGKLDAEKLKKQLQKIAEDVTGGEETERLLNKKKEGEEPALEHSVELTPEGLKGDLPVLAPEGSEASAAAPAAEAVPAAAPADARADGKRAAKGAEEAAAVTPPSRKDIREAVANVPVVRVGFNPPARGKGAKATTPELIPGATAKGTKISLLKPAKKGAKAKAGRGKNGQKGLFDE
jgi:DNA topoisomerase-6 subunit B